jgi:hypothetical protein
MSDINRKESFVLHLDMLQDVKAMSQEEKAQFLDFIIAYNQGETTIEDVPSGMFRNYLRLFANQFDRDHEKWSKTKIRRSEAGRKGGLAKATQNLANARNSKQMPEEPSICYDFLSQAKHNVNGNVNVNKNEKVNVNKSFLVGCDEPW